MYQDLKGKVAIITGSSKGIGAEIAKRFSSEGISVIVNYNSDEHGANEIVKNIVTSGVWNMRGSLRSYQMLPPG